MAAIKCNDVDMLMSFVTSKHPSAVITHPTALQTSVRFECGLIMNVFNTGTVNFQGKSFENHVASDIINLIDAINR
ncbi:hypothetical protein FLM03_19735 [Vibrio cholerae]|uniref:hypothetical protein n=1 Tax=Vibrio cholerae TaxID=666 RepID=UPI00115850D8|nr:hypothetical protein [Vibrio cholerae]TQP07405.1 hypothetical protein FLM03_19735 [Vibrio cholerae]